MKHVVNFAGLLFVCFAFCALVALIENRILYETISGLSEGQTVEEWVEDFKLWGLIGVGSALLAALLWYLAAEWLMQVDSPSKADRRPVWVLLMILPLLGAVAGVILTPSVKEGGWIAYTFLFLNGILCYILSTALFSPAAHKYAPVLALSLRSWRDRLIPS